MRVRKKDFSQTAGIQPGRSLFDLSYIKTMDIKMGALYPVCCDEYYPGDKVSYGADYVIRTLPMIAPPLHPIDIKIDYFFVPYRLLWHHNNPSGGSWEDFITGEVGGDNTDTLPRWPSPSSTAELSLWDYFGMPLDVTPNLLPMSFPLNAYNYIWNEYYMDETLDTPVNIGDQNILYRRWPKDYFTSAMETQQRGTAPSLPISGTGFADFTNAFGTPSGSYATIMVARGNDLLDTYDSTHSIDDPAAISALNKNTVDLSTATTFDVHDIRYAVQVQRILERNNRVGARYIEHLKGVYGVSNRDERLQRPEFLGALRGKLITSEVLQTSRSDAGQTPQGTMAGHGISASSEFVFKYFVREHGLILGLICIVPKPAYHQGVNRQWLRETRYDFMRPEFVNLSEQAILQEELYCDGTANDEGVFGYQGMYDELRYKPDIVCGNFHPGELLDHWNLCRDFSSAPSLNSTFVSMADVDDRIFAQTTEPNILVQFGNRIKALRPIPYMSNPGKMDHI